MRRKRQKTTRRAMRFYRINFGFRPPFKVLVDGNFVHAVLSLKRGDCEELLAHVLGGKCRVLITKCCMHEFKHLGTEFSDAKRTCKTYGLHRCGHDDPVSASECLLSQIPENNPEHFFIATQDRSLQRGIMSIPGGGIVFATVNGIQMESPSEKQKNHVLQVGREKMLPGLLERQANILMEGKGGEVRVHKKKKARGPNPLSMLPKKKARGQASDSGQPRIQDSKDGDDGVESSTKKRSRVRKSRAFKEDQNHA